MRPDYGSSLCLPPRPEAIENTRTILVEQYKKDESLCNMMIQCGLIFHEMNIHRSVNIEIIHCGAYFR